MIVARSVSIGSHRLRWIFQARASAAAASDTPTSRTPNSSPPQPDRSVGQPDGRLEPGSDLADDLVARAVAVFVVDRLEPVQVDRQQGDPAGAATDADEDLAEPRVEPGPAQEAGHRVVASALAVDVGLPDHEDEGRADERGPPADAAVGDGQHPAEDDLAGGRLAIRRVEQAAGLAQAQAVAQDDRAGGEGGRQAGQDERGQDDREQLGRLRLVRDGAERAIADRRVHDPAEDRREGHRGVVRERAVPGHLAELARLERRDHRHPAAGDRATERGRRDDERQVEGQHTEAVELLDPGAAEQADEDPEQQAEEDPFLPAGLGQRDLGQMSRVSDAQARAARPTTMVAPV